MVIATAASIIASQALISGSFTLISEAISVEFWPRISVKFPTNIRGQVYIPSINWILSAGCALIVLYFRTSDAMAAAYGFSITIAILMTTILMCYFLRYVKQVPFWIVGAIITLFVGVELCFFVGNTVKIAKILFILIFEAGLIGTMYVWYHARKITNRYLTFTDLKDYLPQLETLSKDTAISKYASHLIYLTKASNPHQIENKIMNSIFGNNSKRADCYWFIHLDRADEPYTMEYGVEEVKKDKVIRIDFRLGFKVEPRIGLMLAKVVEEMIEHEEVDIISRYPSLNIKDLLNVRFIIMERFLSYDNEFSMHDSFILNSYFTINRMALSDSKAYGLDSNQTVVEIVPLVVTPVTKMNLKRSFYKKDIN